MISDREEFNKRLVDFFEAGELVEFLGITTEDIVYIFEEEIGDLAEDLEEFMEHGTGRN